jgi:hypothetical protein
MSGRPSTCSVNEGHCRKDTGPGNARRGSTVGRLERSNSKWTSGSEAFSDSPPLQPHSRRARVILLKPLLTRYRPRRLFVRGQSYPQLIQKLIVQELIRIEENDEIEENEENEVTVFCHGEDEATVKKVLPAAVKEYVEFMKQESTVLLEQPVVSVNADCTNELTDKSFGEIVLTDDCATNQ